MQALKQWTAGALLGCALALGGSGCGETNSGDGDGGSGNAVVDGPVSFGDFPAALTSVLCDWIAPCCTDLGLPFDAGDCKRTFEAGLTDSYARADPDNYIYDSALAGDCLETAREFYSQVGCEVPSSADEALEYWPFKDAVRVCNFAFGGKLEPGAPCTDAIECAAASDESVECRPAGANTDVCVITRLATDGEACHCVEALDSVACSGTVQGLCHPSDQLYCGDGVCKPKPGWGEPCEPNAVCLEGSCVDSVCINTTDEGECEVDTECGEYGYCTRGTCAADKPKGASCERDQECLSYFCGEGECAQRPRSGINIDISLLCYAASD